MDIELQGNCTDRARMPYHAVFVFLIPLLVAVLQTVNNQGTNKYSFETHPASLWVFLLATIVYCFAFVADIKSQDHNTSYAQLYSLVAVISGSLSSVSLISVFLPDLPGRLIFIPWAFVSIVVSRNLIINLCCRHLDSVQWKWPDRAPASIATVETTSSVVVFARFK